MLEMALPPPQLLPTGLQFLGQPVPAVGAFQGITNTLRVAQYLAEIVPNQFI